MCSELLLDYAGATSNVFSQSDTDRKTLLEQFIFLRKFCYGDNLQGLFEAIKRNPDRILDEEEELRPFGTGLPSKKFYRNPFSYSRGWMNVAGSGSDQQVYLPQMVSVTRKFDRLDTPANRFIKFALHKFDNKQFGDKVVERNINQALESNSDEAADESRDGKPLKGTRQCDGE